VVARFSERYAQARGFDKKSGVHAAMGLEESSAPSFVDSEEIIHLQPSKIKHRLTEPVALANWKPCRNHRQSHPDEPTWIAT
jgi:hypothetical protein